jgi:hypothetical protein
VASRPSPTPPLRSSPWEGSCSLLGLGVFHIKLIQFLLSIHEKGLSTCLLHCWGRVRHHQYTSTGNVHHWRTPDTSWVGCSADDRIEFRPTLVVSYLAIGAQRRYSSGDKKVLLMLAVLQIW